MKIYKIFAISALLICSTIGVAFAENYWCSSDGFGYLATMANPEVSCTAAKISPNSYKSCVENVRKNNENTKADLQKGICKKIQEKQSSYGQTKCKYFYIIENGKIEDKGHESYSLSASSDLEQQKCLQQAREEVAKTLPPASSTTSVKWADQNLSTQSKPNPVSLTPARTNTYKNPSYKYNFPPQYAPAQSYKNPSDTYKK